MYKGKKFLGVIVARGGSKGIPRKNIKELCGKPLIGYTIDVANTSLHLDRVVVSTDDQEIFSISKGLGANVPFIRPSELATDKSTSLEVLQHAINWLKDNIGEEYDYTMLLQPTSPLRTVEDIDDCIKKIVDTGADSVFTMKKLVDFSLPKLKILDGDRIVSFLEDEEKQSKSRDMAGPAIYKRNCAVYLTRTSLIMKGEQFGKDSRACIVPEERSVDINEPFDFELAEFLIKKQLKYGE